MSSLRPSPLWDDAELIERCLAGDPDAWEALLQKYKRLIYAVLMRYRLSEQDAADLFQSVCIDLYNELTQLRDSGALRGWLARVTANACFHHKRKLSKRQFEDIEEANVQNDPEAARWMEEIERDQLVREALLRLTPRCRELLRLLFFEDPPRAYEEVARSLGLATGSIGFIRGRCLKKLAQELEKVGL